MASGTEGIVGKTEQGSLQTKISLTLGGASFRLVHWKDVLGLRTEAVEQEGNKPDGASSGTVSCLLWGRASWLSPGAGCFPAILVPLFPEAGNPLWPGESMPELALTLHVCLKSL